MHLRRASLGDSAALDRGVGRLGGKEGREKGKDSAEYFSSHIVLLLRSK